jgi:cytochrome c-type biogenesis protein CcmH/NrfF
MAWYWWVILVVAGFFVLVYYQEKARRERLMKKYRDAELVDRLMKKMIWQGQSEEQVIDSLG